MATTYGNDYIVQTYSFSEDAECDNLIKHTVHEHEQHAIIEMFLIYNGRLLSLSIL